MNKMTTFFAGPILALFHPAVYRDAAKSGGGRGALYALYLSGLVAVFVFLVAVIAVIPAADSFAGWLKGNMPPLTWTPEGLKMSGAQSYTMTHPQYGGFVTFDMNKTEVTPNDMKQARIFVTSKKLFVMDRGGVLKAYDLTAANPQFSRIQAREVLIDGNKVDQIYGSMKGVAIFWVSFVLFLVVFVMNLIGGLFYSLIAMIIQAITKTTFPYAALFNISCFAMTASFFLMWGKIFTPLRGFPVPMLLHVLLTGIYLFVGLKAAGSKVLEEK